MDTRSLPLASQRTRGTVGRGSDSSEHVLLIPHDRNDPRPGLGPQRGQAILQQSSVPLPISFFCFPSWGSEAWRLPRTLWAVLDEPQDESPSEPTVVFNFLSTLMPLLCHYIALQPHPYPGPSVLSTWEKPTKDLEKSASQQQNGELSA